MTHAAVVENLTWQNTRLRRQLRERGEELKAAKTVPIIDGMNR